MAHIWLQQQKQIYRLRNVHAGYVLYRALVIEKIFTFSGKGCQSLHIPYSPKNKPPPLLILKFLHRYVCLDYKPPSHQVARPCTRTRMRERVRTLPRPSVDYEYKEESFVWW